ncbi:MAG: hypothetical protein AB1Z98_02890 [Nannocystaceae bacterium]
MPSAEHQSLVRLLTEGRDVLRAVLVFVGIDIPEDLELRPGPDAIRDGGLHDYFPDGTQVAYGTQGPALVVEVQLGEDPSKHFTWPLYAAVLRNRLRRPVILVVFTDSERVARWASRPIDVGAGMVMRPEVIGPGRIPLHLPGQLARRVPVLAVLVVVAHGRGPHAKRVGRAALEVARAAGRDGDERASLYLDVIFAYLDRAVRERILEEDMDLAFEPISDIFKGLLARGRAAGMCQLLERLLVQRGLGPSDELLARLRECDDAAQIQQWFDRALTATSAAEVFDR